MKHDIESPWNWELRPEINIIREAAKIKIKSYFLNGSAIKRGGGWCKGLSIKKKIKYWTFFYLKKF